MRGYATFRTAQHGVASVEAADGIAAGMLLALVTVRARRIVEIGAPCALKDIASDRRHVADLRRRARQKDPNIYRVLSLGSMMP